MQLRACEASALAFCRLLERWGRGEAQPATAGGREAALRHAADRVETALAGLEVPLGRYLLELEADQAEGRSWYTGPGAGELVEWQAGADARRRAGVARTASRPSISSWPCSCARSRASPTRRGSTRRRTPPRSGPASSTCATRCSARPWTTCERLPPSITVVGSVNLDLVARVERLPRPGETVTDAIFARVKGGKGANQAVAAARLGADVTLVCSVGDGRLRGRGAAAGGAADARRSPRRGADRRRADPRRRERREPDRRRAGRERGAEGVRAAAGRRGPDAARGPRRGRSPRLGAVDGPLLPQRGAGASDRRRRRPHRRQPLRARGAAAPGRPRRGHARRRGRDAARGRGGDRPCRAAARRRGRRHGRRRRVHRLPARLAAAKGSSRRRRCAAPAPPARSPPRASARSLPCRRRPRSTAYSSGDDSGHPRLRSRARRCDRAPARAREPGDRARRRHDDARQPDARQDDGQRAPAARARRPHRRAGRRRRRAAARARAPRRRPRPRRERPRRPRASGPRLGAGRAERRRLPRRPRDARDGARGGRAADERRARRSTAACDRRASC